MTSPTRPVNIVSPRFSPSPAVGTPSSRRGPGSRGSPAGTPYSLGGTPDLRSLRAQYVGTPPLPNIPPRTGTSTPRPSTSTEPLVFNGGGPRNVPAISGISARRPATPIGLGLEDAPPPDPTVEIESYQEDERVKVLRKHLVSRQERHASYQESSGLPSRQASSSNLAHELQPGPEAFPVPYHTAGADITYVSSNMGTAIPILSLLFPIGTVYTNGSRIRLDSHVRAQCHSLALPGGRRIPRLSTFTNPVDSAAIMYCFKEPSARKGNNPVSLTIL